MLRLGWFSSGRDEASRKLLSAMARKKQEGFLDVDIPFVFCEWGRGEGATGPEHRARQKFFDQVDELGIPLVTLPWKGFKPELRETDEAAWRSEFGRAVLDSLSSYEFDIGVQAGWSLASKEAMGERPSLKIRPALPSGPSSPWQDVIWNAISSRADRHGVTVQLSLGQETERPLAYCSFAIRGPKYNALWLGYDAKVAGSGLEWVKREEGEHEPLFSHIHHDGLNREAALLAYTIKLLSEGKVHIKGQFLYEGDRPLDRPLDLTRDIERALQSGEFKEAGNGL